LNAIAAYAEWSSKRCRQSSPNCRESVTLSGDAGVSHRPSRARRAETIGVFPSRTKA
jgi:hypothetical protein